MSDSSTEQFTLQYQVSLGDSISRLEALQEKMSNAGSGGKKSASQLQEAISEVRGGLSKVAPAADTAVGGIMRMAKGIPVLVAVAAAVVGVAMAMKRLNAEYEKQRATGFQVGMSAMGVEQMQRQLTAGNGRIGPQQARGLMGKLAGTAMSAYTDPSQMNRDAIAMRQIGINPMGKNGQVQSTKSMMDQLSAKFKLVSEEQARAMGVTIGLTADEVRALRNKSEAQKTQTDADVAATARSQQANESMERLNSATGQLSETGRRLSNTLGELLMPVFADIMDWANEITRDLPNQFNEAVLEFQLAWNRILTLFKNPGTAMGLNGGDAQRALMLESDRKVREANKKQAEAAEKQAAAAEQSRATQGAMERSIALFAASVNTFTSTLSEQQMWAAWAGELGKGEGYAGIGETKTSVQGSGASSTAGGNPGSPYELASASATASTAFNYGNIRGSDGKFLRFENKEDGMDAMMRQLVLYKNKHGLNTISQFISRWAPSNENDTASYIKYMTDKLGIGKDESLDITNPNVLSKFAYAMAGMEKGWNNMGGANQGDFRAAADRTLSRNRPGIYAESRASAQQDAIAQHLAGMLGMPVSQFKRGQGVTTGDYDFYLRKALFETQNSYTAAKERYEIAKSGGAPNEQVAAQAKREMMQAEMNYQTMRNYGGQWRDKAQIADRERSRGLPDISVQIYGMQNASDIERAGHKAGQAVGQAVVSSIANSNSSSVDR